MKKHPGEREGGGFNPFFQFDVYIYVFDQMISSLDF